ncbi:MAG: toll/interleukin-1 receptor domain-containing protein [Verrucomicrobia bacterium]|nr:toll/interleukin-1 receptor domain-containing protein [Verrucomicrobiota bacterium]
MNSRAPKYWAFISYSHRDARVATALQHALETYWLPRSLVGTCNASGMVPARLRPVFLDRGDLQASTVLKGVVHEALAQSRYLIVVCSPDAARSTSVDQEIVEFKKMHGESRVLAVIAAGEPFASRMPGREAEECFPEALRLALTPDGRPGREELEPIAADLRPHGDDGAFAQCGAVATGAGRGLVRIHAGRPAQEARARGPARRARRGGRKGPRLLRQAGGRPAGCQCPGPAFAGAPLDRPDERTARPARRGARRVQARRGYDGATPATRAKRPAADLRSCPGRLLGWQYCLAARAGGRGVQARERWRASAARVQVYAGHGDLPAMTVLAHARFRLGEIEPARQLARRIASSTFRHPACAELTHLLSEPSRRDFPLRNYFDFFVRKAGVRPPHAGQKSMRPLTRSTRVLS